MNYWIIIRAWDSWLWILLGVCLLSFSARFYKMRIIEAGKNLAPEWFKYLNIGGQILAVFLILLNVGAIVNFIVYVMFDCVSHKTNLILVAAVLGLIYHSFMEMKTLGYKVRAIITAPITDSYFKRDKIVKCLMQDIENGVVEIRIYQNRIEALRSYNFDVDGYNLPGFSRIGCRELADYIFRQTDNTFTYEELLSLDGERGSRSVLNILNNGERYKFQYIDMKKKLPEYPQPVRRTR